MDRKTINEILGSDMAQHDRRFLTYCIEREDILQSLRDENEQLLVLNAPRGSGKSGLLLQLNRDLNKCPRHIVINKISGQVEYPRENLDVHGYVNFWNTQLLGWLFTEIGRQPQIAFSEAAINAVEYAEKKGAKQKNIVTHVLDKINFKALPIERAKMDPVVRHEEVLGLIKTIDKNFWLLLDEFDDSYDNTERFNTILAGLLISAQTISQLVTNVKIRITVRPHVMKILESTFDKIPTLRETQISVGWTTEQLGAILARRIESYLERTGDDMEALIAGTLSEKHVRSRQEALIRLYFQNFDLEFDSPFGNENKTWITQTLATISMYRPRWLIEYCKLCLEACNIPPVSSTEARSALYKFGKNRIAFLQAEHRAIYAKIELMLNQFSTYGKNSFPSSNSLRSFIVAKIIGVGILPTMPECVDTASLQIARFLHMIDFIQGKQSLGPGVYKHHHFIDRPELFSSWTEHPDLRWVIHPSFANALDLDGNRSYRAGEQIKQAKPKYVELQEPLPGFTEAQKPAPRRRKRRH
ncbi:P-loop ATPase, Sll1717 family [Paucibacter sp. Y2R2-4]|uniref:P-loop ATPase, Sll1717 family n=1 Tax=Paucibacter sp. Y2R2-4 TaxID=2893553 RepID=UPI0021E48E99|nr:hypothetical protein [Paucibacter sp. Y2R2-4]MCV2350813.1 hypothetical protein [Paucibacter sp. Y2R2-4]